MMIKRDGGEEEVRYSGGQPGSGGGHVVKIPSVPFALFSFTCSSCFNVLFTKKKLNKHLVEIHKDPTS